MIKPDMLERPSSLPGHIMDLFGSTGLHLVGCRVFSFSVKQAQAFYGFLEDVFVDKLRPNLEKRIRSALEKEFDGKLAITAADYDLMTTILKRKVREISIFMVDCSRVVFLSLRCVHFYSRLVLYRISFTSPIWFSLPTLPTRTRIQAAKAEVDNIIHYMTGVHPSKLETEAQRMQPGPARCLALLYRGQVRYTSPESPITFTCCCAFALSHTISSFPVSFPLCSFVFLSLTIALSERDRNDSQQAWLDGPIQSGRGHHSFRLWTVCD